jgi:putative transposase
MATKTFKTPEAQAAKNKQISETRKATALKRQQQNCQVYHLKIINNKLSKESKESLRLAFLEAKWLRNAALAQGYEIYNSAQPTVLVKTHKGYEERFIANLGSQVKQSVIASLRQDIVNLSKAKKAGGKIGAIKYSRNVASLDLKQHGSTYRISGQKVKVQGITGWLRVRGIRQLEGKELANAKLLKKVDGYYLAVTVYEDKVVEKKVFKTDSIGLDFGVKTHVTLSDGREFNFQVRESERSRLLQRKLQRQVRGSRNWEKTRGKLGREYLKVGNTRDDLANKFVAGLLNETERLYFQDDNLALWKSRKSLARGGRSLQGSILGRVKRKLDSHPRAVKVPRYAATTATCVCGVKTSHGLGKRWFECSVCGYRAPRDVHAAQNMVRFGSPQGLGAAPVEGLLDSLEQVLVKQETDGAASLGVEASGSSAQM